MKFTLNQLVEHPYHRGVAISPITDITDRHVYATPTDDSYARVRVNKRRLIFWDGVWRYGKYV